MAWGAHRTGVAAEPLCGWDRARREGGGGQTLAAGFCRHIHSSGPWPRRREKVLFFPAWCLVPSRTLISGFSRSSQRGASHSPGDLSGSEEGRFSRSGRMEDSRQAWDGAGQGPGAGAAQLDTSTAKGGAVQLGGGPRASSLLVDLGQQQDEGHGQGTVVEAVDVGVIPVLQGRRRTRLRPHRPP